MRDKINVYSCSNNNVTEAQQRHKAVLNYSDNEIDRDTMTDTKRKL